MTTEDFIIILFCRVDDRMGKIAKHPQARLYPSEVVTLGLNHDGTLALNHKHPIGGKPVAVLQSVWQAG